MYYIYSVISVWHDSQSDERIEHITHPKSSKHDSDISMQMLRNKFAHLRDT